MFTVKRKHFSDANITNILNIRKFFAIFFKKNSPSPPHSLIFATKARGSQQANRSTSQRVEVRQVRRVRQVRQVRRNQTSEHLFKHITKGDGAVLTSLTS